MCFIELIQVFTIKFLYKLEYEMKSAPLGLRTLFITSKTSITHNGNDKNSKIPKYQKYINIGKMDFDIFLT